MKLPFSGKRCTPVGYAVISKDTRIKIGTAFIVSAILLFCYWLFSTACWFSGTFKMSSWGIVLSYCSLPFISIIAIFVGLLFIPPVKEAANSDKTIFRRTGISGQKRPVIYAFEHIILPKSAFTNNHVLMEFLEHPTNYFHLLMLFGHAEYFAESHGWIEPEPDFEHDENGESEFENAKNDELMSYVRAISVFPFQKDGYTAYVLTMPEPLHVPECHLVAILRKDGESTTIEAKESSTCFYTLEKSSHSNEEHFICEWKQGARLNHGIFLGTDKQQFADRVFELNQKFPKKIALSQ